MMINALKHHVRISQNADLSLVQSFKLIDRQPYSYILSARTKPLSNQRYLSSNTNPTGSDNLKVFEENATKWWTGKEFSILRSMNQIRVPFITNNICIELDKAKLLDVGCGGGILSESLARLGPTVYGVDPVFESINQAKLHSELDASLADRLSYRNCNIEDLSCLEEHKESYDGVIASEVLEHITDVEDFLQHCHKLLKPNGSLFITTINQTPLSWLGVIFFGEYVLKQLPKGTHTYDMFVSVKALRIMLERLGFNIRLVNGFMYEPISGSFHWTPTTLTHYAMQAIKIPEHKKNHGRSSKSDINLQQRRNMSSKAGAATKLKAVPRPKRPVDKDDLSQVLAYDAYLSSLNSTLNEFKDLLDRSLVLKASTAALETLPIKMENLDEPLELRDLAQISIKGSNLIVINLSSAPDAIKPTLEALRQMESMNPQVEVNNIYLPVPRITREHRERVAADARRAGQKSKDKLKEIFNSYSGKAKNSENKKGVSQDLIRDAIETIKYDMEKCRIELENVLEVRLQQLLQQK